MKKDRKDEKPTPTAAPEPETPEGQEFKKRVELVHAVLGDMLDADERENPNFLAITYFRFLRAAVESLRHYIEGPEETEITWRNPAAELRYSVDIDPDTLITNVLKFNREEVLPGIAPELTKRITEAFLTVHDLHFLGRMSGFIVHRLEKDGSVITAVLPQEETIPLLDKLKELPNGKRMKLLERHFKAEMKALKNVNPSTLTLTVTGKDEKTGKTLKGTLTMSLVFLPLVIDMEAGESYYPAQVSLRFHRSLRPRPDTWSEEDRAEFWTKLLAVVDELAPKRKFPEPSAEAAAPVAEERPPEPEPLPVPEVVPVTEKTEFVLGSRHSIKVLLGPKEDLPLLELLESADVKDKAREAGLTVAGIDASWMGFRVMHAINSLLTEGKARRVAPVIEEQREETFYTPAGKEERRLVLARVENPEVADFKKGFSYEGPFYRIVIDHPPDFYRALFPSGEYGKESASLAVRELLKLSEPWVLVFRPYARDARGERIIERRENGRLIYRVERVEVHGSPFLVSLARDETTGDLKRIEILPSPLFLIERDSRPLLYPKSLPDEIEQATGRKGRGRPPRYELAFVLWLHVRASEDRHDFGAGQWESHLWGDLARILRMTPLLRSGQTARIKERLEQVFNVSRDLGYLAEWKDEGQRYGLRINPEKFKASRKAVAEVRKTIAAPESSPGVPV